MKDNFQVDRLQVWRDDDGKVTIAEYRTGITEIVEIPPHAWREVVARLAEPSPRKLSVYEHFVNGFLGLPRHDLAR